jgi:hypothetical protein
MRLTVMMKRLSMVRKSPDEMHADDRHHQETKCDEYADDV